MRLENIRLSERCHLKGRIFTVPPHYSPIPYLQSHLLDTILFETPNEYSWCFQGHSQQAQRCRPALSHLKAISARSAFLLPLRTQASFSHLCRTPSSRLSWFLIFWCVMYLLGNAGSRLGIEPAPPQRPARSVTRYSTAGTHGGSVFKSDPLPT